MKRLFISVLILILTLAVSSCGFQLRGSLETSFKSIQINGGSPELVKQLKRNYKQSGIDVRTSSAEKTIEIITDKVNKRILSLKSTGTVSEYQLDYIFSYRIKSDLNEWGAPNTIEMSRSYTYDDSNRLAKQEEENSLIKGMREQIIRAMTSQISSSK
jgi:LPS-assembly lipoprotein